MQLKADPCGRPSSNVFLVERVVDFGSFSSILQEIFDPVIHVALDSYLLHFI